MSDRKRGFVDFRAVKAGVSMLQILEHYDLLPTFRRSQNNENLTGPCPLHGGTKPDQFKVSLVKNVWNCFSECHHGGNVLDFVAKKEDCSIREAAVRVASWFDLGDDVVYGESNERQEASLSVRETSARAPARAASNNRPLPTENKPLGFALKGIDPSHPYLTERGLTEAAIVNFGLGFCAKGTMTGRIAIPITNVGGKTVAYAGRWPGDPPDETTRYKLPTGFHKSLEVFNLDRAKDEAPETALVIVEGFFDAIHLWQRGFRKVVALMGSSLSDAQAELIENHIDPLSPVIVMLDEDDTGREARGEIAGRFARHRFTRIFAMEAGQQPEHITDEQAAELGRLYGTA